ncbi:MAG: undecaprenyl-diphosphate phosphatase [Kiloniellaceae bacterium]
MPTLHILILALVQGITEFLPISSSGHLVVTWEVFDRFGQTPPGVNGSEQLILDIAVHVGTLAAVCLYYWRDVARMIVGTAKLAVGQADPGARLAFYIVLGTIPVVVVGFLFKDAIESALRNVTVVAATTIGFGVVLWIADRLGMTVRRIEHLTAGSILIIGLAQVLALIPGTSRSGITMTAARFLGFERPEAAHISLLLAIPAILGAGTLAGLDLYRLGDLRLGMDALLAAAISFVVALMAIALMLRWLSHAGFLPFAIYRVLLGVALLVWVA